MKWITVRDAEYGQMLERQRQLFGRMVDARRRGESVAELETVFVVEHQSVYTCGLHAAPANLPLQEYLRQTGSRLFKIERGGDVTYHGPGQLVVYPLIDFGSRRLGVKAFIDKLEQAVIDTIADFGITGVRIDGATGVWVNIAPGKFRKICAIGVKCSRFVSMHGLALNISTDLARFAAINPCGFAPDSVSSIFAASASRPSFDEVASAFRRHFNALFLRREVVWL